MLDILSDDQSEIGRVSVEIAYTDMPYVPSLPKMKTFQGSTSNLRFLELPQGSFRASGTIFVRKIQITDLHGNSSTWSTDPWNLAFENAVRSPSFRVNTQLDYEATPPVSTGLSFGKSQYSNHEALEVFMKVSDSSPIISINFIAFNTASGKTTLVSASGQSIGKPMSGVVTARFDISSWTEAGRYRVKSISVYDAFNNRTRLGSSSTAQDFFDASEVRVPSFELSNYALW